MNRYRIPEKKLAAIGKALQTEWSISDVHVAEALTTFFGSTRR